MSANHLHGQPTRQENSLCINTNILPQRESNAQSSLCERPQGAHSTTSDVKEGWKAETILRIEVRLCWHLSPSHFVLLYNLNENKTFISLLKYLRLKIYTSKEINPQSKIK